MFWFLAKMIFGLIACLLGLVDIFSKINKDKNRDKKKWHIFSEIVIVASCVLVIWTSLGFDDLELSVPEIYTTNGNSAEDNEVYMKVDFPLTIWYTTTRYGEAENGKKYESAFCIDESLAITAKSTFFGLKWSEAVCVDIVIGNDGTAIVEQQEEPGSFIKEISVAITNHQFFPGDILGRDSLYVTGTTIYGEEVVLQNYTYEPVELVEGINVIEINYKNLEAKISCNVTAPQLTGLASEYIGDALYDGDFILQDYFTVEGIYENGKTETIDDFSVSPQVAENVGEETITAGGNFERYSIKNCATSKRE